MKRYNDGQAGSRRGALARGLTASAALLFATAGCEVTNPGPVSDEFLTLPASQQGFVNGAKQRLVEVVGNEAYTLALAGREIFPGGQTGSYGHSVMNQAGAFQWDDSGPFNDTQQSRWIAEEAIRRFSEAEAPVADDIWFQAYNWAGYANRWAGELYCEAVIDGGPLEPHTVYWERAEEHFTNALAHATTTDQTFAAQAGRAQTRANLGDWAGAATDAAAVTDGFEFYLEMDFSQGGSTATRNHLFWASASIPYRSYSVMHTFYDDYYTDTGDPRTPWEEYEVEEYCNASLQGYGQVPCKRQLKYTSQDDDIRLASAQEMRLLQAEAILVQTPGDWATALDMINDVRTSVISQTTGLPLEPWTATTAEETWTVLKRERGIELWLEGRRYTDERRWEDQDAPGDLGLPDWESLSDVFVDNPRGRPLSLDAPNPRVKCYAISQTEREQNPNVPLLGG